MTENPNPQPQNIDSVLLPFSLDTTKAAFRQLLPVLLTEVGLTALMLGVYALIGQWSIKVLLGALLGAGLSLANFSAMVLTLLKAERAESPARGQLAARGSLILRMLALVGILVLAFRLWKLDPLATLLPLCLMRLALFAAAFDGKKKQGGAN